METYHQMVMQQFLERGNEEDAKQMKAYMRHQFEFLGIKSPLRREISKPLLQKNVLPAHNTVKDDIWIFWNEPFRELQYFAMDLINRYQRHWTAGDLPFFEKLVLQQAWWDTVDGLSGMIGKIVQQETANKDIMRQWNASGELWKIRVSILFQLKYKEETDAEILAEMIRPHTNSKEFFIQKAAGWALRQYSKYNPEWVINFINNNVLPSLTRREASKYLTIKDI